MNYSDLLDIDTWAEVKKASPKLTIPPIEVTLEALEALSYFMQSKESLKDLEGRDYWTASLKELIDLKLVNGLTPIYLGKALRAMGMTPWREGDGYHVAWTRAQFNILDAHATLSWRK